MKEIIGDDYPTYEESVNMSLAEQKNKSSYTYMTEVEHEIHKHNVERLIKENIELKRKLEEQGGDNYNERNSIEHNYVTLKAHLLQILEDDFKPIEDREHLSLDRDIGWKIVDALDILIQLKKLGIK